MFLLSALVSFPFLYRCLRGVIVIITTLTLKPTGSCSYVGQSSRFSANSTVLPSLSDRLVSQHTEENLEKVTRISQVSCVPRNGFLLTTSSKANLTETSAEPTCSTVLYHRHYPHSFTYSSPLTTSQRLFCLPLSLSTTLSLSVSCPAYPCFSLPSMAAFDSLYLCLAVLLSFLSFCSSCLALAFPFPYLPLAELKGNHSSPPPSPFPATTTIA